MFVIFMESCGIINQILVSSQTAHLSTTPVEVARNSQY